MTEESKSNKILDRVFPILCLILAIAVIYVSYENVKLKHQLNEVAEQHLHDRMSPAVATSGQLATPFDAYLPDGRQFSIRTDSLSAPLILAWLSWDCQPCLEAVEPWNELFDYYPGQLWGVAKMTEGDEDSSWAGRDTHFAIVNPTDDRTFRQYGISMTPQTMIVGSSGTIDGVWFGPLNEEAIDSIEVIMRQPFVERR